MIDNKKHLGGECVDSYILCLYLLQSSQRNKRPWCLGSHFSNFIFPFLLILFAMSYYVREIVNSLYYSILKKSSFFFFTWQREILTSVFHLLTWLLTFKFWTTAFNMLGLIAQMGQGTPSKYTQKCSWRFAIWP